MSQNSIDEDSSWRLEENAKAQAYCTALNEEKSFDESGLDPNVHDREMYEESLEWLINERRKDPNMPIYYTPILLD